MLDLDDWTEEDVPLQYFDEAPLREQYAAPRGTRPTVPAPGHPAFGFRIRPAESDQDPDPEDAW